MEENNEFRARQASRDPAYLDQTRPLCLAVYHAIKQARIKVGAIHLNPAEGQVLEYDGQMPDRLWGYPLFLTWGVRVGEFRITDNANPPLRFEEVRAAIQRAAQIRSSFPSVVMHPDDYKAASDQAAAEGVPVSVILARIYGF